MILGRGAWIGAMLGLAAVLAGCDGPGAGGGTGGDPFRPQDKPAVFDTTLETDSGVLPARVDTRSGEIMVRDLEGKVRRLPLDSAAGREALARSEAEIAGAADGLTAQEQIEAEFEAQTRPALPEATGPGVAREVFLGAQVARVPGQDDLVEVRAYLKQGVDADSAFAYATCALAAWATENGAPFARHIRTLEQGVGGRLMLASVFMLSRSEPMGLSVVETRATLAECRARGIPAA